MGASWAVALVGCQLVVGQRPQCRGFAGHGRCPEKLGRPLRLLYATVSDKDVPGALACLPDAVAHHWCAAEIPRAMPVEELARQATAVGRRGHVHQSVAEALNAARNQRSGEELVVVLGSVFTVGEALASLGKEP